MVRNPNPNPTGTKHPDDPGSAAAEAQAKRDAATGMQAMQIHLRAGAAFWEERALQLQAVVLQKDAEIAGLKASLNAMKPETPKEA